MKKAAIALLVALAICAWAGTTIGGDRTITGGINITATAGTGGVTAKLLAAKDASNPTAYVIPASGGCGSGIAASTVSAAASFLLYVVPGLSITGVADNTVTAGHILVGGTTTPGRVKDSGQTSRTAINSQTCIVGVAQASASTAGDVLLRYDGSGTYGTGPIASGTAALGTSAISSATCATVVTVSAAGTLTTDVVSAGFNGDPTAVTGYIAATTGMLSVISYPTADNVNFKVCNNTASSVTPGAITLNWRVAR